MNLRIADATRDAIRIAQLAETTWRHHYTAIIGSEQVDYMLDTMQSASTIASQIRGGRHYRLIENESCQTLGYLAYDLHPSHLFLSKLYVLPSEQRNGIGSRSLTLLEDKHPAMTIRLTVNKHNKAAIAFYLKAGFTNTGSIVTDIGCGFVMDDWKMEKSAHNKRSQTS